MKKFRFLGLLLIMLVTTFSFAACSDDDDDNAGDLAAIVSGDFVGTVQPIGYVDEPATAYVRFERRSSTAVSVEFSCETYNINPGVVFLTCTQRADGTIELNSESNKAVYGTYKNGSLTFTLSVANYGDIVWVFTGYKS